ncbi:MAG: phage holin family protein [Bacteroidetes bacterium]|jgi:putative membrane protein|nr:phage holin family protein [Bacteroidota bacterium]
MRVIVKLLLTAVAVIILARLLPGISVSGFGPAFFVAIVLALLRFTVKPILLILTLPITILTFGLFILVINAIIILLANYVVPGFTVSSIWWAMLFSLLLSFFESILFSVLKEN